MSNVLGSAICARDDMRMDTAVTQEIDYARLDELKRDSHRYETEDGGTPPVCSERKPPPAT